MRRNSPRPHGRGREQQFASGALSQVTLEHLYTFVAVHRLGSFGLAAAELCVTQSAVSQRIKALELALGTELFLRQPGRSPLLTEAGAHLLSFAQDTTDHLERALAAIRRPGDDDAPVAVGYISSVGRQLLPSLVKELMRRVPDARIRFLQAKQSELTELVKSGAIDVAVLSLPVRGAALEQRPLLDEPMLLVAAPFHPILRRAYVDHALLARTAIIMPEGSTNFERSLEEWAQHHGIQLSCAIACNSVDAMVRCALLGVAPAFLPALCVAQEIAHGSLVVASVRDPLPLRTLALVTGKRALSPMVLRVVNELQHLCQRTLSERPSS